MQEAIEIAQQLKDPYAEETDYARLAIVYQRQGDLNKAIECYSKAASILERLQETKKLSMLGNYYYLIGMAFSDKKQRHQGRDYLSRARDIFASLQEQDMLLLIDNLLDKLETE